MTDGWIDSLLACVDAWSPGFATKPEGASED